VRGSSGWLATEGFLETEGGEEREEGVGVEKSREVGEDESVEAACLEG